jgi:hypothetical protein
MAQKRRFTPEFKTRVVLELISAPTCRGIGSLPPAQPQVVSGWKAGFLEKACCVFQSEEQPCAEQARIAGLERMVGRLTLELEVTKKPQPC